MNNENAVRKETENRLGEFGIEKHALQQYRALCDKTPGLQRV